MPIWYLHCHLDGTIALVTRERIDLYLKILSWRYYFAAAAAVVAAFDTRVPKRVIAWAKTPGRQICPTIIAPKTILKVCSVLGIVDVDSVLWRAELFLCHPDQTWKM